MAHILILSSWVAGGHVGASAAQPALHAIGHRVTVLPTVLLSNHPAWPHVAGHPVAPDQIAEMETALSGNGLLDDLDAVLTGYLPTPAHVALAAALIDRRKRQHPDLRVVVDPILGDTPKGLYIRRDAALAIRDHLLARADILTPNLFELGWLTSLPVDRLDRAQAAVAALDAGRPARVLVTSAPISPLNTGVLEIGTGQSRLYSVARRPHVPPGTGDVFSGLIAAGLPTDRALGYLQAMIAASSGATHLRIAEAAADWSSAPSAHSTPFPEQAET